VSERETAWCISAADYHGWPVEVFEAAYEVYGARIFNAQGRTFKGLHRRVMHALRTWEAKYGAFNEAQEAYAAKVLAWAIRKAAGEATDRSKLYAYVQNTIAKVVNHDRVHKGFLRRADDSLSSFDPDELLRAVPR
jgi:hypothetical protein